MERNRKGYGHKQEKEIIFILKCFLEIVNNITGYSRDYTSLNSKLENHTESKEWGRDREKRRYWWKL